MPFDLTTAKPVSANASSFDLRTARPVQASAAPGPGVAATVASALVRPVLKGAGALPLLAMDFAVAVRDVGGDIANKVLGRPATPDYELPSDEFNRALDAVTVKPAGVGKAAEFVSSSLLGGMTGTPEIAAERAALAPATRAARSAGYVLPPSQARPTLLNGLTEGLAGKVKTQQLASLKNQGVTNGLVRRALGLKADAPITVGVLKDVREQAGRAYAAITRIGNVDTDAIYHDALAAIGKKYASAAKDFGRTAEHLVSALVTRLSNVSRFTGDGAVNEIGLLREEAEKAAAQRDKSLAAALRQAAGVIESQVDRHLVTNKAPAPLIRNFRQARELIAKSYSVQSALDRATGDVSAPKLAAQLARDKPMSGELRKAAEFGTAFPKAAQLPSKVGSVTGYSPLDLATMGIEGASGLTGAAAHSPRAAAVALGAIAAQAARPAIRAGILTPAAQRLAIEGAPAARAAAQRLTLAGLEQEATAGP